MSEYGHDEAMRDLTFLRPVHRVDSVVSYITRIEAERDEALATAADFESKMHRAVEQLDEWKRVAEWLAGHIVYARKRSHTIHARKRSHTIHAQDCPSNTDCEGVDCYSDKCSALILNAAIEAVRGSHE